MSSVHNHVILAIEGSRATECRRGPRDQETHPIALHTVPETWHKRMIALLPERRRGVAHHELMLKSCSES